MRIVVADGCQLCDDRLLANDERIDARHFSADLGDIGWAVTGNEILYGCKEFYVGEWALMYVLPLELCSCHIAGLFRMQKIIALDVRFDDAPLEKLLHLPELVTR